MAPLGKYRDLCSIEVNLNESKSKMHITFRFKFDHKHFKYSTSRPALRKLGTNCQYNVKLQV